MNFVVDVLENQPSAKPALVAVTEDGEGKVWSYGELTARSAGLAGADHAGARGAANRTESQGSVTPEIS